MSAHTISRTNSTRNSSHRKMLTRKLNQTRQDLPNLNSNFRPAINAKRLRRMPLINRNLQSPIRPNQSNSLSRSPISKSLRQMINLFIPNLNPHLSIAGNQRRNLIRRQICKQIPKSIHPQNDPLSNIPISLRLRYRQPHVILNLFAKRSALPSLAKPSRHRRNHIAPMESPAQRL